MPGQKQAKSGHKANAAAKQKRERYWRERRHWKNKLKRIARSNGRKAAVAYARANMLTDWARKAGVL